jgi:hypothetical protein
MRVTRFVLAFAAATVAIMALVSGAAGALAHGSSHGSINDQLAKVRAATARYHTLSVAKHNGYALLTDAAGIACIANPPVGTMGVHFVNGDLVAAANAGNIDPTKPQAVVYEPEDHGQMRLVAVEYVVFQQQWDATHNAPPNLFGQQFMLTPDGNRFGLPAFYSLHAWIWKVNPDGMFAMWNPRVDCH